ncbi:ABC transporter substrate-binding protein [Brevibacillus fluminis]|uniref:ABC transporter substrate-binding protein n=1 Tax=Brevibacillus fluminis TaxID=511487 RepID=A0A3M8DNZ1_9BACL|nr:ABC transporter substrate-binding protein [Brevibacillus fluminis]RNB89826.1 ABC transporter substrate-binding protein [Brevibacillus fluminis]
MKGRFKKRFLTISLLSLFALSACSNAAQPTDSAPANTPSPAGGDKTIFVGINNPPATLNPINGKELASMRLSSILFETLLDLDEDMKFLPKLADSMETTDNQNFVIKLNPKANWTDGQPFTADDVVFTLQLMANPKVISTGIQTLSVIDGLNDAGQLPEGQAEIKGIKIVDPHTLSVHTKEPVDLNYMKEKLGTEVRFLPKHVLKDVEPEKLHQHPFMQKPNVTDGAFTLVQFVKDQYVEFAANKSYYRGAPKVNKLIFKIMPATNIVAQLQTGEIQMNEPETSFIPIEDYEKVKNMSNVTTVSAEPFDSQMMFINSSTLTDRKVRQAIAYAINRQMIVDNLLKGAGEVLDGPYTTVHPYYNKDVKHYPYDTQKAKQLLSESGWDANKPIDLAVPVGNKAREQFAVIISENLQAVGFKVKINKYDLPTLIQKGIKHEFDLLLLGLPFYLDPDVSNYYKTGGPYNFSNYSNPTVDSLIESGKKEASPGRRHVIYNQLSEILQQDLPIFTLYGERPLLAISKKVKGAVPKLHGMLYNIHEWDIEQ